MNFRKGKDVWDWEVGKNGIILKWGYSSATFLPEVASEQGWDKETTLAHLARKGGHYGKMNEKFFSRCELETYESSKISATFDEWLENRKQEEDILRDCGIL